MPPNIHGQAADEVFRVVLHAHFVGDKQDGQKRDGGRQRETIDEDDEGGFLEIGQLGRLNLAVHLRQCLFPRHGQDGVSERDEQTENAEEVQPTFRFTNLLCQIGRPAADEAQRIFLPASGLVHFRLDFTVVALLRNELMRFGIALILLFKLSGNSVPFRDGLVLHLGLEVRNRRRHRVGRALNNQGEKAPA